MAMPTCVREEDDDDDDVRGRRPRGRRARHWVGLAIVGVQMAAWCLVGALLMHRGVANLRRRDALAGLAASARVLPAAANDSIGTTEWPLPTAPTFPPMSGETDTDPMAGGDGEYPKGSFHHLMRKWSSFVPVRPMSGFVGSGRESTPNVAPATPSAPGSPAPAGKTAGAATAVVMVTVGGVMLVVGPAFMAIKIMDVYHRQKRLGKVSRLDDPPPSYDEVAEKAPRYSALFQVLENGELAPLAPLAPLPFEASASVGLPPTTATPGPSTAVDVSDSWDAPEEGQDQEADASTPLQNTEISRTSKPCDDDRRRSV